jgi:hypothetical protein
MVSRPGALPRRHQGDGLDAGCDRRPARIGDRFAEAGEVPHFVAALCKPLPRARPTTCFKSLSLLRGLHSHATAFAKFESNEELTVDGSLQAAAGGLYANFVNTRPGGDQGLLKRR